MEQAAFKLAKKRYKLCEEAWAENRKMALEAMEFCFELKQWPEEVRTKRIAAGRPCLVVDKLGQYVRQVVNDGRQNRPGLKIRPIDSNGDEEIADVYQGVIRHILDRSNADEAFDSSLEQGVVGGYGWLRVTTDYAHKDTFEQEICVDRIPNQLSVLCDPNTQKADKSDMRFAFVVDNVPKDIFAEKYPNAEKVDWESEGWDEGWIDEETVKVCEYWYVEDQPRKLHLLADGSTIEDSEYKEYLDEGTKTPEIKDTRDIPLKVVKWCRMSGQEILEEIEYKGEYIPLVFVAGCEYNIDGKVLYVGLVRPAMDAARIYNFSRSAYVERVALTPKAPWVAAAEAVEDYPEWEDANTENYSVLRYNSQTPDGTPIPPPQRQTAVDIPEGFARDMQISEHDIQAAMGMYNASLGERSNEKSGKAIMARQREGDVATFHFQDNLNRAIKHLGRILIDLIPKYYDSRRIVRILGEDGTSEQVQIDPNQEQAVTKMGSKSIYNLGSGTYDVSVAAGPSYTTKRQESAEAMLQLTQANPSYWQTHGDLIVKAQDWPYAEEFADRTLMVMPPELRQMIEGSEGLPPEAQQAMQQVQQAMQQVEQQKQQIEMMGQQLMQEKQQVDADKASAEAERAKLEAAKSDLDAQSKVLSSRYQELSAKLELQAMKAMQAVPPVMPPGINEPAIEPTQPPNSGFFTP